MSFLAAQIPNRIVGELPMLFCVRVLRRISDVSQMHGNAEADSAVPQDLVPWHA